MDERTVRHYTTRASERAAAYESVDVSGMHELMLRHFGEGSRLLEVGCGSGRDAAYLRAHGREVTATDASEGMIGAAKRAHPEMGDQFHCLSFPPGSAMQGQVFDGIYAIAVIMHVPDDELFEFAFQIKSSLRSGGTLILSFSTGRSGLGDGGRDTAGRLFVERPPGRIRLLFERLGFRLIEQRQGTDGMGRDIEWHTLVLRLADDAGNSPVDQIETVINRDRKDATYKLALLRALCDIAQTDSHQAVWGTGGTVSVPLGLVAEKWLPHSWLIVEADLAYEGPGAAIPELPWRPCRPRLLGKVGAEHQYSHHFMRPLRTQK